MIVWLLPSITTLLEIDKLSVKLKSELMLISLSPLLIAIFSYSKVFTGTASAFTDCDNSIGANIKNEENSILFVTVIIWAFITLMIITMYVIMVKSPVHDNKRKNKQGG